MTRRVLAIDGGGIRGIIPAMVTAYIEKRIGRPTSELFDLIVGTSTGGMLALALACPRRMKSARLSARLAVRLYEKHGPAIFEGSLWRKIRTAGGILEEAYSHQKLEGILKEHFGDTRLVDCKVPTMVTGYDIQSRKAIFLKSWRPSHAQIFCRDAARATTAAPTFFEPKIIDTTETQHILIDGGIFINSPSVSAYAEARVLFPQEKIKVLSLGTGELTRPVPYHQEKRWGSSLWVTSLMDCMFDGTSKAADYQMRLFLGKDYQRLQIPLVYANDDMDDASKGNIRNLKQTARELIENNLSVTDQFFE